MLLQVRIERMETATVQQLHRMKQLQINTVDKLPTIKKVELLLFAVLLLLVTCCVCEDTTTCIHELFPVLLGLQRRCKNVSFAFMTYLLSLIFKCYHNFFIFTFLA